MHTCNCACLLAQHEIHALNHADAVVRMSMPLQAQQIHAHNMGLEMEALRAEVREVNEGRLVIFLLGFIMIHYY